MDPFGPDLDRDIILIRPDGHVVHVRPVTWPVQFCASSDCPNSTGRCVCSSPKRVGGEQVALSDHPQHTASFDGASTTPPADSPLRPTSSITSDQTHTSNAKAMAPAGTMMYNEYGDLVDAKKIASVVDSKTMEVTKMIRLIHLNFHHLFKRRMGEVINAMVTPVDGKSPILLGGGLLSWEFNGTSISTSASADATPEGTPKVAIYAGAPRVLEIGCDQGSWCFRMKEEYPDWIIEGLDSMAKWRLAHPEIEIKDFMDGKVDSGKPPGDYFSHVHTSQTGPEFTVRDFNSILNSPNPIPHNLYGLVRGRDVFAKVDSYKTFLEDVRLILQPDGVVEFLEIDPRPRRSKTGDIDHDNSKAHKSGPETDYTNVIADRFKNLNDEELATDVPAWASRVAARIQASLRPRDGVPAANLKDWIQGAGFWDVKQLVIKLPVGGSTQAGTLLKQFIIEQIETEDEVPRIREAFSKIEEDKLASGLYHLNLHIVTGRKPLRPRTGDLLLNGTRMEMDDSKYDAMARFSANPKAASHWQRYDVKEIDNMMEKLHLKT